MTARRIAVFTSTRADYWPMAPVVELLASDPRADPVLWAGGTHLDSRFGATVADLPDDIPRETLAYPTDTGGPGDLARSAAELTGAVSARITEQRPDLLVVLGDRFELLGVLTAAVAHQLPVVHLHGGELTEGAIDDAVRHAVTKLSQVHCCATESYRRRIVAMGEEPGRVHVTGAPALDRLLTQATRFGADDLSNRLGIELRHPAALVTYHSPTATPDVAAAELDAVLEACRELPSVLLTFPGADLGSTPIIAALHDFAREHRGAVVVESLGELYPTALATVDVVIGNSSSGIVEAPTFGVPTVNVGHRQRGRERAPTVIDVAGGPGVTLAVREALARPRPSIPAPNPYGDGTSAPRVVEVLLGPVPPWRKTFHDGPAA